MKTYPKHFYYEFQEKANAGSQFVRFTTGNFDFLRDGIGNWITQSCGVNFIAIEFHFCLNLDAMRRENISKFIYVSGRWWMFDVEEIYGGGRGERDFEIEIEVE